MQRTPDEWFARFQRTRDPAALGELFDLVAPELFRVALHLAGNRAGAEDLVQWTFLTALQDERSFDPALRVVPWLFGILGNRARYLRRMEARQVEAGRLVASAPEDPRAAAERQEFRDALERGMAQLPEVYRQVLVLHLFHGLTAKEIAVALGRPAGTVRTQVVRGMDLLRAALPAGFGAAVLCAVTPAQALIGVRAAVLTKAGMAAGAGARVAWIGGVLAMGKVTWVAAVAVVAVLAGLWWWGPGVVLRDPPAVTLSPASAALLPVVDRAASAPSTISRAAMPDVGSVAAGDTELRVHVRYEDRGDPAVGVEVDCKPSGRGDQGELMTRTVVTDAAGVATFTGMPAGQVTVIGDRGGRGQSELAIGRRVDLELLLPAGHDVTGVVVDAAGAPASDALVWVSEHGRTLSSGRWLARCGPDGRFRLRSVAPGRLLSAARAGVRPAGAVVLPSAPPRPVEIRLELGGPAGTLTGQVFWPDHAPVSRARVAFGMAYPIDVASGMELSGRCPESHLWTDPEGRFACAWLGPIDNYPLWVRAEGAAIWRGKVRVVVGSTTHVDVQLERGATVRGTARDASGQPVAGARLSVFQDGIEEAIRTPPPGPIWARPIAESDPQGRFNLEHVLPGRTIVRAEAAGARAEVELMLVDGEDRVWDPVLGDGLTLRGEAHDDQGIPLAGWEVSLQGGRGVQGPPRDVVDALGRFAIPKCVATHYRLSLREPASVMHQATWQQDGVTPSAVPLTVVVPAALRASAFVTGDIVDASGVPAQMKQPHLAAWRLGSDGTIATGGAPAPLEQGRFRVGPLRPGRYRFAIGGAGGAVALGLGTAELGPGATVDLGRHCLEEPGTIRITLVDADGALLDAGVSVTADESVIADVVAIRKGTGVAKPKQPGRYRVQVITPSLAMVCREVEVRSGVECVVGLRLPAVVTRRLREPAVRRPWSEVVTIWRDAQGTVIQYQRGIRIETDGQQYERAFAPGRYSVEVQDHAGASATATFTVDARPTSDEVLELPLPASLR